MSDAELLARWDEAYRVWLGWYHDETPDKGWGVGQDAAFHMGRVAASLAECLRAAQSGDSGVGTPTLASGNIKEVHEPGIDSLGSVCPPLDGSIPPSPAAPSAPPSPEAVEWEAAKAEPCGPTKKLLRLYVAGDALLRRLAALAPSAEALAGHALEGVWRGEIGFGHCRCGQWATRGYADSYDTEDAAYLAWARHALEANSKS